MNAKKILTAIGLVLIGIGIIKVSIIGYYPREMPFFIGVLIVGAACTLIGQKLPTK
ncbi:hypothetical protein [Arthrobacter sp. D2-10]